MRDRGCTAGTSAGKPVKLVWTRQEEFMWGYFRPAGVIDVKSGAKNDGTITAWEFHTQLGNSGFSRSTRSQTKHPVSRESVTVAPGSYRVGCDCHHFARESQSSIVGPERWMDSLSFDTARIPRLNVFSQTANESIPTLWANSSMCFRRKSDWQSQPTRGTNPGATVTDSRETGMFWFAISYFD